MQDSYKPFIFSMRNKTNNKIKQNTIATIKHVHHFTKRNGYTEDKGQKERVKESTRALTDVITRDSGDSVKPITFIRLQTMSQKRIILKKICKVY